MVDMRKPVPGDPVWYRREAMLTARCLSCPHAASVKIGDLEKRHRLNREMRLWDVRARLGCSICGAANPLVEVTAGSRR